jgi:hypothetical protein
VKSEKSFPFFFPFSFTSLFLDNFSKEDSVTAMKSLTPTLYIVLLGILFVANSAENIFSESKISRTKANDLGRNSRQQLVSYSNVSKPSNNYIRTNDLSQSLTLKAPSRISRPSVSLQSISPNLFMQLIVGNGTAGYSGDGSPATSAQVTCRFPWVDSVGNVYLPGDSTHRIRRIDTNGIINTFGGTGTSSVAGGSGSINSVSFFYPGSIVGDVAGTVLYITDQNRVWKYVFSSNIVSVIAGTSSYGFSGDNGPASSAQVTATMGLWLTTGGDLFVADINNHRIRIISSGIIRTVAGSGPSYPNAGTFAGDNGPATSASLRYPYGVYMDTLGRLFIADSGNRRIRSIDTNGIITTFAGTGNGSPFNSDVPATTANIDVPNDVKGDTLGNIFLSEEHLGIRMVDTTGVITVVFGNSGSLGFSPGISSRTSALFWPQGIWIDSNSNIYFSDFISVHKSVIVSSPTSQPSSQPTTQPTVRISSSLKNALVAYYPFDGNAHDNSGNGNHGVVHGGVSLVADRFGNVRSAMQFDGSSGYIEIPGQQFNFVNNVSICFWIKPNKTQLPEATIIDKSSHTASNYNSQCSVRQNVNNHNFYRLYCFTSITQSGPQIIINPNNNWNHLCFLKSNTLFSSYLNGILVGSFQTSGTNILKSSVSRTTPLILGATGDG